MTSSTVYLYIFRSTGNNPFNSGLNLQMNKDSSYLKLIELFWKPIMLKLFVLIRWPVFNWCFMMEEKGGLLKGKLDLTDSDLCSAILHFKW